MRVAGLIAVSLLVAGCSQSTGGEAERITPIPPNTNRSSAATTPPTSAKPIEPPAPGAPIGDVIKWIEAGQPADSAEYHVATRDGATSDLGEDVAFTTPSGKTNCMTDSKYSAGALACLVDLIDPPPQPDDAYGEWKGGWVDYDGKSVMVGSVHGDPGRFTAGSGPELPYGKVAGLRRLPLSHGSRRAVLRQLRKSVGCQVQRRGNRTVRLPPTDHRAATDRQDVQLLSADSWPG